MTAPQSVTQGSLTDWPVKIRRFAGWILAECDRPGCHAILAEIHIADLDKPIRTTHGVGLAAIEAHEPSCPTPAPVQPETCGAEWTVHWCGRDPGHPAASLGDGHRCTCGAEPIHGERVTKPRRRS